MPAKKKKKPKPKKEVEREKMKEGDTVQSEQFICRSSMTILSHLSTVAGRWRVVKLLGSGGFGDVYKVQKVDNPDKTESAMKTEMVIGNRQMLRLKIEVVVLMKCHEQPDPERKAHFVAFVDRGKTAKFKACFFINLLKTTRRAASEASPCCGYQCTKGLCEVRRKLN
ncbi:hypothetical protein Q1695_006533 [Nippostrongylus brasiliensis]|nr:hypothetical protein Q1695_006533 [Nippostrongylus brasiliensis]